MKVYIDGQEYSKIPGEAGAASVLNAVREDLSRSGRVITEIRVDGVALDEEAFLNVIGDLQVHFTSQSVRTLVHESLDEALNYVPRLTQGLEQVAASFEGDGVASGQARLAEAAEGMDWLLTVFQKCSSLLAVDQETESAGLDELKEALSASINLLGTFYEEKKYPQMALCIRQRLVPEIGKLSLHIRRLHSLSETTQ
ncbi:MAG: hypothetical protein LBQ90_12780 [Synergistaceae bacterium]|jgi:hypothetical protein|nr:hypothetical protein [Synergistaceae bacterium]